jgi:hypothetical protein
MAMATAAPPTHGRSIYRVAMSDWNSSS